MHRLSDSGSPTPAVLHGMVALFAAAILTPLPALAQVCLGSPTAQGQLAVTGDANLTNQTNDFGAGIEYNVPGPLALRAGVALEEAPDDERVARFEGRASFDVLSNGVSVCPVTGADYSSRTVNDESRTLIRIPLGVSVGGRVAFSEDGPALIPSVRAGVSHRRFSGDAFATTVTETSAFLIGGGSVALEQVFVRGEAGVDSADEVDPFYRLSFGVRF